MVLYQPGEILPDTAPPVAPTATHRRSWPAELELWFASIAGKTRLARRRHSGPLLVQKPFYPEKDGSCHVYLLHPPAGIVGGDRLAQHFHVDDGARVVLTTPGATRFYRSLGDVALQSTRVEVGAGAVCEFLPQETIIFAGANARVETTVTLAPDAVYAGWDFICLGRPAAGEGFTAGRVAQRVEIVRDGRPVWFERMVLSAGAPQLAAAFALSGQPTAGAMVYAGALPDDAAERVRAAIDGQGQGGFGDTGGLRGMFSASQLEDVVVCRYLGPRVADGKAMFVQAWDILRKLGQGKPASAPRIWAT